MWLGLGIRITNWWRSLVTNGPFGNHATLTNGLVSVWPVSTDGFDAHDSNDLTNNNGVTFVPLGPSGVVADFIEANSEYLENTTPSLSLTTNMTLSYWANPKTGQVVPDTHISKWSYATDGDWLSQISSSGLLTLFVAASPIDIGLNFGQIASQTFVQGQWGHVVWVYDGAGVTNADRLKCYFNGVLQTITFSGTISSALQNGAGIFDIGRLQGVGQYSAAHIGRVGVWSNSKNSAEVLALFNTGSGKSYSQLTTAEKVGLVSYWNLDEASGNRTDSHGSNTLTDNNTVGSATNSYPANMAGTVANFVAASSQNFSHADDPSLSFSTAASWSFWIKPAVVSGTFGLITKWDYNTQGEYAIEQFGTHLFVRTPPALNEDGSTLFETTSITLTTTDWWHVVVTFDGSLSAANRLKVYVNGVLTTGNQALTVPAALQSGTAPFVIGNWGSGIDRDYGGLMSSPYIWSKALTSTEVSNLWSAGDGLFY